MSKHIRDRAGLFLSMESDVTGIKEQELEYTFYGQVKSIEDLKERCIRSETHEQWLVFETDDGGKVRIRAIDGQRFVLTTKYKKEGYKGCEEVECDISKDMFIHLKKMGSGGMMKKRYFFKIEDSDLIWEVDVFKNARGEDHDWVKLDLEVESELDELPKLPVEFINIISHQSKDYTPEEQHRVSKLWSEEWVSLDSNQLLQEN